MLLVCEPLCEGLEHVPFNTAVLQILAEAEDEVMFLAERSHLEYVERHLGQVYKDRIHLEPLHAPPRRAGFFGRLPRELSIGKEMRNRAARSRASRCVFTAVTPSTLFAIRAQLANGLYQVPTQVFLHGGLAEIVGYRSRNPLIWLRDTRSALSFGRSPFLQYIVLEYAIREALEKEMPHLAHHTEVLEHPLPVNERGAQGGVLEQPVRFGFLGLATRSKGFGQFLEIAKLVQKVAPGAAEFHAIGSIPTDVDYGDLSVLAGRPSTEKLERGEYVARLQRLHYVCLPYHGRHYDLSASGALLDAVAFEKPILGSEIALLRDLFRRFGDIGELFSSAAEWERGVRRLAENPDPRRFADQQRTMGTIRASREKGLLVERYRSLSDRLGDRK